MLLLLGLRYSRSHRETDDHERNAMYVWFSLSIWMAYAYRGRAHDDASLAIVKHRVKCCTHRPSLLPIEWLSENSISTYSDGNVLESARKLFKLGHLEEVKVVTRYP